MASALEQARAKYGASEAPVSALEAARAKYAAPTPGVGETAARHGLQGLTLGFSDELSGVGSKIGDWLASKVHGLTANQNAYVEGRDAERERLEATRAAHPGVAFASELIGGAALPVPGAIAAKGASLGAKVVRGAVVGAGTGAVAGAGTQDSGRGKVASAGEVAQDAAVGGTIGGAVGGALPVAGAGLRAGKRLAGKLGEKTKDIAVDKAIDAVANVLPVPPIITKAVGKAVRKALSSKGAAKVVEKEAPAAPVAATPAASAPSAGQKWGSEASEAFAEAEGKRGFERPYDAAEKLKYQRKYEAGVDNLDPETAKWAAEAQAAERALRAREPLESSLHRRINGIPDPALESSESARALLSGNPSVNIRRPLPPPPSPELEPLAIRPPPEPIPGNKTLYDPLTEARMAREYPGRPIGGGSDGLPVPDALPKGRTAAQDRVIARMAKEGVIKPNGIVEMNSLKELTKHKDALVVYDKDLGGYRIKGVVGEAL